MRSVPCLGTNVVENFPDNGRRKFPNRKGPENDAQVEKGGKIIVKMQRIEVMNVQ